MDPLHKFVLFFDEIARKEKSITRETLAGYIVSELIGDYDGVYKKLLENNPKVERVADLASDLEWSNGSDEQLDAMWLELKALVNELTSERK